jgi:hypothetical protein
MVKRGRKRTNEMYFGPNEEEAVIKLLEGTNCIEKVSVLKNYIATPFLF